MQLGVEGAIWDLFAKAEDKPLYDAIGGTKQSVEVGISIGIQPDAKSLVRVVSGAVEEGYKRVKMKIQPGADIDRVDAVREAFPDLPIMVDANSAYTLNDTSLLKQLDRYHLTMIEQPLAHDDIIDHATLQSRIDTPVCLDESIHSLDDARKAIDLHSCRVINVKIGRVGGIAEAIRIHDHCSANGVPVWCGGMLETGIGRAHNIAIATLPNFSLPGDTASAARYWNRDVVIPEIKAVRGVIDRPEARGIGYEPDLEFIRELTTDCQEIPVHA